MASTPSEFELLLRVVDLVTANLAQDLLKSQGIPSYLAGPDFDIAELGASAHAGVRRQDLFVPRGSQATARKVLVAAWGEDAVAAHEKGDDPPA